MGQAYANTSGVHSEAQDAVIRTSKVTERADVTAIDEADAVTYTAAQILGGVILRDCAGSGRSDILPTATLMVAAMKNPQVGDVVRCLIVNGSDGAETITLVAGTGGDFVQHADTRIIAQNASKTLHVIITGVETPAYVPYI